MNKAALAQGVGGGTHEGQGPLIDVAAGPGVPVDLGGGPGHDPRPRLPLGRLERRHLALDQRHRGGGWVHGLKTRTHTD